MATHPRYSSDDDAESASFDMILAIMLWLGAICLVCAVSYGAIHGVPAHLHGAFVVLHRYYGQWVVATLATIMGAGMFQSARRRLQRARKEAEFFEGAVLLESARWVQQPKASPPANAGNSSS